MHGKRDALNAVVAGEDLSRRAADGQASRAVLETLDVDATTFGGELGVVDPWNEQGDHLRQVPAQGLAGDVGAPGSQEDIEFREVVKRDIGTLAGDHVDMSLGELACANSIGKAGETIEDRHCAGQLTVGASSVGSQNRRDLDEILSVDIVIDPLRKADAFIELGEFGQFLRIGLGRLFQLLAGEVGVIGHY